MINHWNLNHPQWTSEFSYLTVDSRLVSEIVLRRVVMEAKCLCFNCHTQTICSKLPLLLQMRNASSRDHPLAGYFPPCSDCIESKATTHHARRLCTCVGLNAEECYQLGPFNRIRSITTLPDKPRPRYSFGPRSEVSSSPHSLASTCSKLRSHYSRSTPYA